ARFSLCAHSVAIDLAIFSLHDALPISIVAERFSVAFETVISTVPVRVLVLAYRSCAFSRIVSPDGPSSVEPASAAPATTVPTRRSEEHTSELQSRFDLVCRLLLEKKKI